MTNGISDHDPPHGAAESSAGGISDHDPPHGAERRSAGGISDHDPPHGALLYSAAAFTVGGLLFVLLALLEECLRTLHAVVGTAMLLSAIFVLRAAFASIARAASRGRDG